MGTKNAKPRIKGSKEPRSQSSKKSKEPWSKGAKKPRSPGTKNQEAKKPRSKPLFQQGLIPALLPPPQ